MSLNSSFQDSNIQNEDIDFSNSNFYDPYTYNSPSFQNKYDRNFLYKSESDSNLDTNTIEEFIKNEFIYKIKEEDYDDDSLSIEGFELKKDEK